jgi:hypothetical protein
VNNPFFGTITSGALAQPGVTRGTLLRRFPQFSAVDVINNTAGNSIYHALQVKIEKRLSSGTSFLVSYTFGKLISDTPWAASGIEGNNRTLSDVRAPGVINLDASLFKNIRFRERLNLQFRAEFFNVLNHANFAPPNTALGNRTFGQISSTALLPRVGQLALKLTF